MVSAPPAYLLTGATQKLDGGHLLGSWRDNTGDTRQDSLQAYIEYSQLSHVVLQERRATLDLEYQQRRLDWAGHDLIWGLGYRGSRDDFTGSAMIEVTQRYLGTSLYSAYLQDEISVQPDRWRLTLGARLEHNDYTGYEFQPNARLLWTPDPGNSVWLALSHAIRTPTRTERGLAVNAQADPAALPLPTLVQYVNSDFQEERLNALDLGWRHQITASASLDLAAFYYRYSDLRGAAPGAMALQPGYIVIPLEGNNGNSAVSHGLEAALDWRPRLDWRLQASYSLLRQSFATAPGNITSDYADTAPAQMFSLRASVDLIPNLRGDAWLRHVSSIKLQPAAIPAYTTLDLRLAWQARKNLEIALVGQNLLDAHHPEYRASVIQSTPDEIERSVYLKAEWKY
jgi:iron complex outermembrane receptor protein